MVTSSVGKLPSFQKKVSAKFQPYKKSVGQLPPLFFLGKVPALSVGKLKVPRYSFFVFVFFFFQKLIHFTMDFGQASDKISYGVITNIEEKWFS